MPISEPSDEPIRELVPLMTRLSSRLRRLPVPNSFSRMEMTPRHLQLLSCLLLEGPHSISELAEHLSIAPTTVSMIVGELSHNGVLLRREVEADRRRRMVDISRGSRPSVEEWLAPSTRAWRRALDDLSPVQRRIFVDTLTAYDAALSEELD